MRWTALLGLLLAVAGCVPPVTDNMRRGLPTADLSSVAPPPYGQTQTAPTLPAAGYGAHLPPIPSGGIGPEAPMSQPPASRMPTIAAQPGPPPAAKTNPAAGQSIMVPNGNGTTTIIHTDGTVETIPTPK